MGKNRSSMVLKKIPIPEELSDLMYEILKEAKSRMDVEEDGSIKYGLLLQPWFDEEEKGFFNASFAVVDYKYFDAMRQFVDSLHKNGVKGTLPFTSAGGGIYVPNRNAKGERVGIALDDLPSMHLIKPPVYAEDDATGVFTEEYDD